MGLGRILEVGGGVTRGGYTQSGDVGVGDCIGQKKVLDYLQLEVQAGAGSCEPPETRAGNHAQV